MRVSILLGMQPRDWTLEVPLLGRLNICVRACVRPSAFVCQEVYGVFPSMLSARWTWEGLWVVPGRDGLQCARARLAMLCVITAREPLMQVAAVVLGCLYSSIVR